MTLDLGFNWHESRRPVMLRPVEFDASGDPWPREPDEGRLNHILPIEKVVSVGFVQPNVNPSTDLRQYHQAQIRVLDVHRFPRLLDCRLCNAIHKWKGVDPAAATLVHPRL